MQANTGTGIDFSMQLGRLENDVVSLYYSFIFIFYRLGRHILSPAWNPAERSIKI